MPGLTCLGRRQIERLCQRWLVAPEFEADILMTSNHRRASKTAELLHPVLGARWELAEAVGERDPGPDMDGQLDTTTGPRSETATGYPDGESIDAFFARVEADWTPP